MGVHLCHGAGGAVPERHRGRPACIRTAGIGQATARIFAAISGNQAAPLGDEDLARLDRIVLEVTCARV